jgi:hypothetical protein
MKPIKKCNMQVGKFYLQKWNSYITGWQFRKVLRVERFTDRYVISRNAPCYENERSMPIHSSRGYRYYELSDLEIPIYILKVSE